MDEQADPNLEQLADVEAPDAVSRALRRFRWRTFLYISLPIVLALAVIGAFLFVTIRPNLDTVARIERVSDFPSFDVYAPGRYEVDGGIELIVLEAVELDHRLSERLLNRIFQPEVADRGTPVGVQLVLIAPDADEETEFDVRPMDPLENNFFAGSPQVGRWTGDPTVLHQWFVLQPHGRDKLTFVILKRDRDSGNAEAVAEVTVPSI